MGQSVADMPRRRIARSAKALGGTFGPDPARPKVVASQLGLDDLLVHRQEFGLLAAYSQELDHMNNKTHMYLMVGLVVGGGALFFSGLVDGGALFLLWPLACVAMMVWMMWAMRSMSRGPLEHTHDDGVSHSHGDVPKSLRK